MYTSDELLAELKALHPRRMDLSLGRIEALLAKLGNPHDRLPPVVHIAGTNGKGSTAALLKAMLQAAGKRIHVYTSPHLVRFHERIELAGADGKARPIGETELVELLERTRRVNDGGPVTFFEITTAAAFEAFAQRGRLVYQSAQRLMDLPLPALMGQHQVANAGAAIAAALQLKELGVTDASVERGLLDVRWPARMQRLDNGPLSRLLAPGSELWLDGAHNPAGAEAIAPTLAELEERAPKPVCLIV